MTKNMAIYLGIIGVLAVCLIGAIGALAFQFFKGPLAPSLIPVLEPTATLINETIKLPTEGFVAPTAVPTNTVEATTSSRPFCGSNQEIMTILIIQRDNNIWERPFGADGIRLARIDFVKQEVVIFAFPRDLWVSTPSLKSKYGIDGLRLGSIYTAVLQRETGKQEAHILATSAVAQTLYDNFKIAPTKYITLDENAVRKLIDALGGIEVNIPADVNRSGLVLKAGKQMLNGQTAEFYSRYLDSASQEWDRLDRQNRVLSGVRAKLQEPAILVKIPALIEQFRANVITDLSLEQIAVLSCVAQQLPMDRLRNQTIDINAVTIQADDTILLKDIEALKTLLKSLGF